MIMEIADESPRAYVPFHLAVKSSQPQDYVDTWMQRYPFRHKSPNNLAFI